jgi:hypothetical protein
MNEKPDGAMFRGIIGLIALMGAMGGFFLLFVIEIPLRNENALLLALGFVMGWAGAVIASEYGSTSTGRKIADSAIRGSERLAVAAAAAALPADPPVTGRADDPVHVADGSTNGG